MKAQATPAEAEGHTWRGSGDMHRTPMVLDDSSKKDFLDGEDNRGSPSPDNSFQDDALEFEDNGPKGDPRNGGLPESSFEVQLDMSRIHFNPEGESNRKSTSRLNETKSKSRPPTDDEGLQSSRKPQPDSQGKSMLKSLMQKIGTSRKSRYEIPQPSKQQQHQEDNSERGFLGGEYDETTNMLTQPAQVNEIPEYSFIMAVMVFTPVFFIVFYIPHPIFSILHFLKAISNEGYAGLQSGYIIVMSLIFVGVNTYSYFRVKKQKKEQVLKKDDSSHLNKIFNKDEGVLVTPKNLIKIVLINSVSVIGLIDTAFDLQFVALCYGSGVVWLAILIGILYIYTFFDKIHSTRKLVGLARDQYRKRYDRQILKTDHQKAIQFYSACLSIFSLPLAETFTRANLKTLGLQRRVLLFEAVHIGVQKMIFIILKTVYHFLDARNKSGMINYAIPMNFVCTLTSLGFILYKFHDLKRTKRTEDLSQSGSEVKRFVSQVTQRSVRFRQHAVGDLLKLEEVVQELEEARKKAGASLGSQTIDKLKVKLLQGDMLALRSLVGIVKKQHFLRELSFYKMSFTADPEFECLSDLMHLRRLGLLKVSFKECQMAEDMVSKLVQRPDLAEGQTGKALVKDISLQLKVHDQTDYEIIYQQLRKIAEAQPVQILFEPLYYTKRREDSLLSKFGSQQISILGESQHWPKAISAEYQHLKRFYLVQPDKNYKGTILFFKDRTLHGLFDRVIMKRLLKKGGMLDLENLKDIFTHSFHQERFLELLLRALEDNIDQVTHLKVRIINETAFQEKYSFLGIRPSQFKRLLYLIPDKQLTRLSVNMSMFSFQDSKAIEHLFQQLSDFLEGQSRSLKHLTFTGVTFDLNSTSEKDFYNSLSFPNLASLALDNCKFACYDAFERFFNALTDTENTLERLEITRLNSSVSAKGFKELLLSQCESLQHLTLHSVHKNILSKKYHRKVLPAIAACANLRTLSLRKNQLDYERLKVLAEKMTAGESFQELTCLDLAQNQLENNAILIVYRMLKARQFSLDYLDLSENSINEEGLNLLLKGKTDQGGFLLTKGVLANKMLERNFLINNAKASKLDRLEVSGSFAAGADPSVAVQGFQMLGILNNSLTTLDASKNALSAPQVQLMLDQFFLSKLCSIVSLNLSQQRFNEENLDSLFRYLSENPALDCLTLNDCKLRDSFGAKVLQGWFCPKNKANKSRGELHLEGNQFGEQLFLNILDELEDAEVQVQQPGEKSLLCQRVNLGRNTLTDEAVGNDLIRMLTRLQVRIFSLDLHENQALGRPTLIHIRDFVEDNKNLAFTELDLSDCHKCLKSAVLLEMRKKAGLTVRYTREAPKVVKAAKK